MNISHEAWIAALAEIDDVSTDQSAVTFSELMKIWGLRRTCTQAKIRKLIERGLATRVFTRRNYHVVPGYLLTPRAPEIQP